MSVYFLYAKKARRIKIGYSKNPQKRISGLQTTSPEKLIQLAVLNGKRELEQAIHLRFGYLRENGEWFRATDELFEWIHEVRRKKHIPFVKISMNDERLLEKNDHYRKLGYVIVHDYSQEGENLKC